MKSFEDFMKEGVVKKVSINRERARNMVVESERRMRSLDEHLKKIGIRDENANDYVEYCYDIIMHLLRAKMYLDGYSSSGQGAHEAEVSYMKMIRFSEKDVRFADQIRYFRNGILYYGTTLDREYAHKVIDFAKKVYQNMK